MTKLPATTSALVANLQKVQKTVASNSDDGVPYLRLLTDGDWVFGGDNVEDEDGARWAVNPHSFKQGFIAWGDSADVLGEEMASISEDPIIKSQLPEVGAKWAQQISVQLACIEGDNKGQNVLYKTTAKGGIRALMGLIDELIEQAKSGAEEIVPIITLGVDSYKHKKYGKTYVPVLDVDDWVTVDAIAVPDREDDDTEEEEAPKPKRTRGKSKSKGKAKKKAKAEEVDDEDEDDEAPDDDDEEDEDEAPAPRRRRRRRTS